MQLEVIWAPGDPRPHVSLHLTELIYRTAEAREIAKAGAVAVRSHGTSPSLAVRPARLTKRAIARQGIAAGFSTPSISSGLD
jgi:hypothetical protein